MDPENAAHDQQKVQMTLLPKYQLFINLLIQSSEAITATVIYPFIAQLIRSTGITQGDETKVGYYAGIIESIFFISECALVFQWGRAADKFGRRPILLMGPLGLAIAMLGFGLSRTFWPLVVFRAAQGVFNGNIGVSKTVMAEITDATNRADAFTMIPIMWTFGTTLGPTLGGFLAQPASTWPNVFGRFQLFIDYPFFLPCFAAGLYAFVTFVIPLFSLKETLPSKTRKDDYDDNDDLSAESPLLNSDSNEPDYGSTRYIRENTTTSESSTICESPTSPTQKSPLTSPSIFNPALNIILVNYCLLTFTEMSYSVLIPLLYSTSPSYGGLGFSTRTIGTIMATFSFTNAFIQMLFLKDVLKKLGARKMYIISYASLLMDFGMLMVEQVLVRNGYSQRWVWAAIAAQLASATLINTAYSSISILIVEAATPGTLAAVNGLAQAGASGFRGLGPSVASSLFALSLHSHLLGGYMVYVIMFGITIAGTACSLMLPVMKRT
ncbi:major facilitator superfamily multidrug-dha1 sub-family [Moniliophthora roreri]|nr:major facilitator superfamily multidrug-dha1 sub-family [Moniliophthora roreri]